MVRRAAAIKLRDLVKVIDKQSILVDIIPVCRQLANDTTDDAIRVSAVHICLVIAEHV